MRKTWTVFAFAAGAALLLPTPARAQWKTPWSYSGPAGPRHWGHLDPAYAACDGKEQSPIDIEGAKKADLPALRFEFRNGPVKIINNGFTAVRVDYGPENGNVLIAGGQSYRLTQFHFHHPSEEEVHGKSYDMVIHFMFQANDGKVAGVAVLVREGAANSTVAQLWKYMPRIAGKAHTIPGLEVNPVDLLPRDTGYYKYVGSVTAPPCTEGVTWFVLKTPVSVSSAQVRAFAKLYPHDVRPVQPLNGRVVEESR